MLGPRSMSTRHTLTPPPSSRNSRPHRPQTESTPSPTLPCLGHSARHLAPLLCFSLCLSHTHHHLLSHFTLLIKLSTPCQIGWPLPCRTATILVQVDLVSPGTTRTPPPTRHIPHRATPALWRFLWMLGPHTLFLFSGALPCPLPDRLPFIHQVSPNHLGEKCLPSTPRHPLRPAFGMTLSSVLTS